MINIIKNIVVISVLFSLQHAFAAEKAGCNIPPLEKFPFFKEMMKQIKETTVGGKKLADLKPEGIEDVCPGYSSSSNRETCWGALLSAISFPESGWKPETDLDESTSGAGCKKKPGQDCMSRGLFQMSVGSLAKGDNGACSGVKSSQLGGKGTGGGDPKVQISCAITKAIQLNTKNPWQGALAKGNGKSSKGLAGYWAVMRDSERNKKKKDCILAAVKKEMGNGGKALAARAGQEDKVSASSFRHDLEPYWKERKKRRAKQAKLRKNFGDHFCSVFGCDRERVFEETSQYRAEVPAGIHPGTSHLGLKH